MKVLFTNTWYFPHMAGGGERSVQFLAESLVESGDEAVVVCTGDNRGVELTNVNGVKVYRIGIRNVYWPFPTKKTNRFLKPIWHTLDSYNYPMSRVVSKIIECEMPDLIHSNGITGLSAAIFPRIKNIGIPVVQTLRNYYLMCPGGDMFKDNVNCEELCSKCRLFSMPRKQLTLNVDAVVGVSRYILDAHVKKGYFRQTPFREVIYNSFRPKLQLPRDKKKWCDNQVTLGYIGRLHPTKGIEYLLEAMRQLPEAKYNLVVAGEGKQEYEEGLKAKYSQSNISFIGHSETDKFFDLIDILVVPSIWNEPLGRVILESYAFGVPVIVADVGGCSEIVEMGKTGVVIPPRNTEAIVQTVLGIDRSDVENMSMQAFKKSKEFLPENILSEYLNLYQMVVRRLL